MSLEMQTVNVIPRELMQKEKEFYDMMVRMHAALRDRPNDEDPH